MWALFTDTESRAASWLLPYTFASICRQATTTETEEEELPVWARREVVRQLEKEDGVDLPFGVYLLASALVAIAAVSTPCRRAEKHVLARERFCRLSAPALCRSLPQRSARGASHLYAVQVGSVFEFANKNAIFGAVPPSSPLYAPILLTFAVTGIPSAGAPPHLLVVQLACAGVQKAQMLTRGACAAGYLFFKAINSANREAERQDRADGF